LSVRVGDSIDVLDANSVASIANIVDIDHARAQPPPLTAKDVTGDAKAAAVSSSATAAAAAGQSLASPPVSVRLRVVYVGWPDRYAEWIDSADRLPPPPTLRMPARFGLPRSSAAPPASSAPRARLHPFGSLTGTPVAASLDETPRAMCWDARAQRLWFAVPRARSSDVRVGPLSTDDTGAVLYVADDPLRPAPVTTAAADAKSSAVMNIERVFPFAYGIGRTASGATETAADSKASAASASAASVQAQWIEPHAGRLQIGGADALAFDEQFGAVFVMDASRGTVLRIAPI
jgi:hypothetical protein